MSGVGTFVVLVATLLVLATGATTIWWLQSAVAERARRENPDDTDRAERLDELENNRRIAERVVRVIGPAAAVAVAAAVLVSVFS